MMGPSIPERIARIRAKQALPSDLDWLRARPVDSERAYRGALLICDCRCICHSRHAWGWGKDGACAKPIDLDTLDCERGCRSQHILASECSLDETRAKVGAHV